MSKRWTNSYGNRVNKGYLDLEDVLRTYAYAGAVFLDLDSKLTQKDVRVMISLIEKNSWVSQAIFRIDD